MVFFPSFFFFFTGLQGAPVGSLGGGMAYGGEDESESNRRAVERECDTEASESSPRAVGDSVERSPRPSAESRRLVARWQDDSYVSITTSLAGTRVSGSSATFLLSLFPSLHRRRSFHTFSISGLAVYGNNREGGSSVVSALVISRNKINARGRSRTLRSRTRHRLEGTGSAAQGGYRRDRGS